MYAMGREAMYLALSRRTPDAFWSNFSAGRDRLVLPRRGWIDISEFTLGAGRAQRHRTEGARH